MCGICGIIRFDGRPVSMETLKAMNDRIVHRGPDDEGYFTDGPVGIACRRLSIIDVAGGHQPIVRDSGALAVAQNGEIYNFRDLTWELSARGTVFQTACDTEVILEAYRTWGADCAARLNGMFAFVIYDRAGKRIHIARDRSGIKPLFYYRCGAFLAFASEIKALLVLPEVARKPDPETLDAFLKYKYIPGERSLFEGISKLLPAHWMTVTADGAVAASPYWQLTPDHFRPAEGDASARLRETLTRTVERQMISDVSLGAFLSGGIDSTILVGLMSRLAPNRVKTFSMGFRERSFNELPFARTAAEFHRTDHREFICEAQSLLELVPALVGYFDEPLGDASMIPTYLVARETRKYVTVALAGTGADELFAGYDRHRVAGCLARYNRLPAFVRRGLIPAAARMLRVSGEKRGVVNRLQRFLRIVDLPAEDAYENLTALFGEPQRSGLYAEAYRKAFQPARKEEVARWVRRFSRDGLDFLQSTMGADLATILPNDYLTKDDRMSMACSLEVRVPFLDHEVIEAAARIPSAAKLKDGVSKAILRETFADLLPPALAGRKKYGFEAPIALWMSGPRLADVRALLTSPRVAARGILDVAAVGRLLDSHASRAANRMNEIFSLLTLEFWFQRYID